MAALVDVMFQLIIFIILSSTFVMQPGIKVNLPSTVTSEAQLERNNIVVSVTEDGSVFLEDKKVTLHTLPQELKTTLKRTRRKVLVIKADEKTFHGIVVKIMDIGKMLGIEKLAIATQPKELLQ
jgi:biopolymer transport protein ExbD